MACVPRVPIRSVVATPAGRALVLFVLALAIRAAWGGYAQPIPVSDYADYLGLAERLVVEGSYPPENFRFPGMVWFLAAVLLVSGGSHGVAIAATVVLSAAGVVAAWLLFRVLWRDERVADAGAIVVALEPTFVLYAPVLGSEHLLMPLVLLGLAGAARDTWSLRWRVGTAALALGLATLTRGEALFYLLPCAIALWPATDEGGRLRRALPAWLALGAGVALVALPWVVRNERVIGPGAGLSTSGGSAFYYGRRHGPGLFYAPHAGDEGTPLEGVSPVEGNRLGWKLGWALVREDPWGRLVARVPVHTIKLYAPSSFALHFSTRLPRLDESGAYAVAPRVAPAVGPGRAIALLGWCGVLVLVALASLSPRIRRSAPPRAWLIVGGLVVANALCYAVVFHGDARYRYVPQAALCGVAGLALARLRVDRAP